MELIFKNADGETEICLRKEKSISGHILFDASIHHSPFLAQMKVEYVLKDFMCFLRSLDDMYAMRTKKATLFSLDWDLCLTLEIDDTGHIIVTVNVNAGVRGNLNFDYNLDQSFIKGIREQVNEIIVFSNE